MFRSVKICDDISWIGVNDFQKERFENYIPIPNGVSYNSYIIRDEKICVIDAVEINTAITFMDKLHEALGGRKPDYFVVNHVEPDHSSGLKELVRYYPDMKIIGNAKSLPMLKALAHNFPEENFITIKEGDEIDLGKHKLTFAMIPMVHWPESMVTYDKTSGILFSNDAFGGFGALSGGIFDDEVDLTFYKSEMRKYYSNIVGKYGAQVVMAIKKLGALDIKMICPAHGILWRRDVPGIVRIYEKWAKFEPETKGVVIVYGSMYGNTAQMAEVIGTQLRESGITDIRIYDSSKVDSTDIVSRIWKYQGLILGSCAHNTTAYPKLVPILHKLKNYGLKNRFVGIFGSMMWSGGGVRAIQEFVDSLPGLTLVAPPVEAHGSPKEEDIAKLKQIAISMAEHLNGTETSQMKS
ncbi:MAG: FprA family A-type flavoprotein [Fusobacteriaceae bacterium]|jgi:flavorubredoxin|nr:FprA family A-type flavoprotein [Fusobacteriaceae bacterium]